MISALEKEITFRFLKARKKDGFLNVISIFSFIGISLGVAVLIIVMSVMNGFRTELINKIVGFNSHITVKSYDNVINQKKLNSKSLKLISKNIIFSNSGEAIILKNNTSKGIVLRGYKSNDFLDLEIIKNNSVANHDEINVVYTESLKNKLKTKKLKNSSSMESVELIEIHPAVLTATQPVSINSDAWLAFFKSFVYI